MAEIDEPIDGVWLPNIPLDLNEGAKGHVLLEVVLCLAEQRIADLNGYKTTWNIENG